MNADILFIICCVFAAQVYGYNQNCDQNQTIFASEESTVTFRFKFTSHIAFRKTDEPTRYIFHDKLRRNENITIDNIHWYDRSWEQRSHIEVRQNGNGQLAMTIVLSKITMKDNGTYLAPSDIRFCFIVFVMQLQVEPRGPIEENKPVYVYAHPHKSVIKRPFANATMFWLLNGATVNDTASFIQDDGYIWIPYTNRDLDGKNVTYRAVQENGVVNDVNYTLNINYGPTQPLTLTHGKTQYYLTSRDVMPNITCSTECKPPCSVSWGNYSNGPTLSLGTVQSTDTGEYTCIAHRDGIKAAQKTISLYVADEPAWTIHLLPSKAVYIVSVGDEMPEILCTAECNPTCNVSWGIHSSDQTLTLGIVSKEMTGEYTCTATRKGSVRRAEKSITIYVQDNSPFTAAIACLASFQALMTLGVGLYAYWSYRRSGQTQCKTFFNTRTSQLSVRNPATELNLPIENVQLDQYEVLDINTRLNNDTYGDISQSTLEATSEDGFKVYENTETSVSKPKGGN